MSRRPGRSGSLYRQILIFAATIGALTAALTGLLTAGLVRAAEQDRARHTLSRLADASATSADLGANPTAGERRAVRTLTALQVHVVTVTPAGRLQARSDPLAKAVTPADVKSLAVGHRLATTRTVNGGTVLVQGRPTRAGAIVLLQRQQDAIGSATGVVRRTVIAFAIAFVLATLLTLLVTRRIVRPLRRTADAAHALAQGERDVAVSLSGPVEVESIATAINTLATSLAETERQQRDFVLSVSHDLRTPLTTITGYAESLADGVIPADEVAEVGATVLAESQRLTRMVTDLLDLGRLDTGELRVELVPTDLTQVVHDTETAWRNKCAERGVRLQVMVARGVVVTTDAGRIRQVLDNLLDNAVRLSPPGAVVALELRVAGDLAELEVRDSGPGITDEDLPVAFERGVLRDRYRGARPVGTGLGLAIVRGVTGALGGHIEPGHAVEGGARFTIRLPIA